MTEIHVLDSETIDKIAAGEVVERPSSVVKELVENAIDAGAKAITVEAKNGGIDLIRVTDDGSGMESGQLRKAFLRHATSKITSAEDLTSISSLGFRGEALSSIAAVAKVEVITKTGDSMIGSRYVCEGGQEISFEEVGAPEGTTFLARNLFFNTPVRRKFLHSPQTEGGYIADLMEHLALSRPDISFKLVLNNQMKFHTSGNGDLREVIYRIYGRDAANALVPIQTEQDGVRVEGYLGKPVQVRSNRNFEIYFINGRFVRSNVVARAIEEGYKEYLMQHKFPFCVLHITMDLARVDVNVHPTKMDVRFTNAYGFSAYLCGAVKLTLKKNEMIPEALLSTTSEKSKQEREEKLAREKEKTPEPFETTRVKAYHVMEEMKYESDRPKMQEFLQNPSWTKEGEGSARGQVSVDASSFLNQRESTAFEKEDTRTQDVQVASDDFFSETAEAGIEVAENALMQDNLQRPGGQIDAQVKNVTDMSGDSNFVSTASEKEKSIQLNLFDEKILTKENRPKFRIIGQVFETYWLIEFENKLLMIDQHAAHEKVNYERFMKRFREKAIVSQRLMPPIVVTLSAKEEDALKEHLDVFAGLGFEIEAFGGKEYALRSVPVDLYGCEEREMFLAVLDQLADGGNFGSVRVVEEKIASMSCKAAVKGNQLLSMEEAKTLIDELLTLENPYNCPHGRPTIIAMSKTEMDKKFKRIVS